MPKYTNYSTGTVTNMPILSRTFHSLSRRSATYLALVAIGTAIAGPAAHAQFIQIDVAGAASTLATGLDGYTVVGNYIDGTSSNQYGFTYNITTGLTTELTGPTTGILSNAAIEANKISNSTIISSSVSPTIVGDFADLNNGGNIRAYYYSGNTYHVFDATLIDPLASATYAEAIRGNVIAGWYTGGDGFNHAYAGTINNDGSVSISELPDNPNQGFITGTEAFGVDGIHVVGVTDDITNGGNNTAQSYDGTSWSQAQPPFPTDTSSANDTLGGYTVGTYTSGGSSHGYVTDNLGDTWSFDVPVPEGPGGTVLEAISAPLTPTLNPYYRFVGSFADPDTNISHGFYYEQPVPEPGTLALFIGLGFAGFRAKRRKK